MKAKDGVLDLLNRVLTHELTAIHQYILHASLCDHWGYERLRHEFHELATEEIGHVSGLIDHILYLEGDPDMQRLGAVQTGRTVPELLRGGLAIEQEDVAILREAIAHCAKVGDYATRHRLEDMLTDTEGHIDRFETHLRTIEQTGHENFLSEQIKKRGT